jgi:hypothetical protein
MNQIQLEPHRRHYTNSGWNFVLRATGHDRSGYRGQVDMVQAGDRWFSEDDPQYPSDLEATGATREEALDALAARLDEVFTHLPEQHTRR